MVKSEDNKSSAKIKTPKLKNNFIIIGLVKESKESENYSNLKRKIKEVTINKNNNLIGNISFSKNIELIIGYIIIKYLLIIGIKCSDNLIKSKIILKLNGTGNHTIYNQSYLEKPNEIYINGNNQSLISHKYDFNKSEDNKIELIWNHNISNCSKMFYGCSDISEIDLSYFYSSQVIDMSYMFYNCKKVKLLNFSNIDTSQVAKMNYMFYGCSNLTSLDLSSFNTSTVRSMSDMFNGCKNLIELNLSNFDTSQVSYMGGMFGGCSKLEKLNLSNFNTSSDKSMRYMFSGCSNLRSLYISNFDTSKVTWMNHMFNGCSKLVSLNISNFDTSIVTEMQHMFNGCSNLNELNITNFNTIKVTNMSYMFNKCSNLTKLELYNFDTSLVNDTSHMFYGCSKIISLNLSSFNTSKVEDMGSMFAKCSSLISLVISNFDTSKVTYMAEMFMDCINLSSLNLSSFKTPRLNYMGFMFKGCSSLTSLNLSNFNTSQLKSMRNAFEGCSKLTSLDLSNLNVSNLKNISFSFHNCGSMKYINLKNFYKNELSASNDIFKGVPDNVVICYYNNNSLSDRILDQIKKIKYFILDCSDNWKTKLNKIIHNTSNCISNYINYTNLSYEYNGNCSDDYINYSYNSIFKIQKCTLENCLLCSQNELNVELCNICNKGYYPKENISQNFGEYINCYNESELQGYYLDKNDLVYKKCYYTCDKCITKGNYTNHKCLKCNSDFKFEKNISNYKNCYKNCSYYYFNKDNNYFCTYNYSCPDEYNKLIPNKKKCVKNCSNDDIYKYEYNNICYKEYYNIESTMVKTNYQNIICNEEKPFENTKTHECVKNCNIKDLGNKVCILRYEKNETNEEKIREKSINIILDSIKDSIISGEYNITALENGVDDVIEDQQIKITLTTVNNQKNNIKNNNLTIIDLGDCELLLRQYYNISENENIYMTKIDIKQEGMKIPKIEYDIYAKLNGTNLKKLNKSICDSTKITLSIPVEITENIDKLNSSSKYYNDHCYTATSNSGTDILLNDRKIEFITYNKTLCQEECDFTDYNYDTIKANCSCKIKESNININKNKTKLVESFGINEKSKSSNFGVTSCDVLSSTENIKSNTGFYLLLFILVIFIITFIIFCIKGYNALETKMDNVIYKRFKNERKKKKNSSIISKNKNKPKKNNKIPKKDRRNKANKSPVKSTNNSKIKMINKLGNKSINKPEMNIISNAENIIKNKLKKKDKIIKPDTDYEFNWLLYKHALKFDKRECCEYYCSLIRNKQLFIFTFCSFNDYNSGIIKKFMLFLSFALHYTSTAIFFDENTIHQIYKDKGEFNFNYQLPKIFYSAIISTVTLRLMLHFLVLTDKDILEVKLQKTKEKAFNLKKQKLKCIIIKFTIFFVLNFILLGLFWFYLTCLNAIYKNSQVYLIETTFISFGFSLIYPFIINIFPTIIRMNSLHSSNKSQEYCYKISQVIQVL